MSKSKIVKILSVLLLIILTIGCSSKEPTTKDIGDKIIDKDVAFYVKTGVYSMVLLKDNNDSIKVKSSDNLKVDLKGPLQTPEGKYYNLVISGKVIGDYEVEVINETKNNVVGKIKVNVGKPPIKKPKMSKEEKLRSDFYELNVKYGVLVNASEELPKDKARKYNEELYNLGHQKK